MAIAVACPGVSRKPGTLAPGGERPGQRRRLAAEGRLIGGVEGARVAGAGPPEPREQGGGGDHERLAVDA